MPLHTRGATASNINVNNFDIKFLTDLYELTDGGTYGFINVRTHPNYKVAELLKMQKSSLCMKTQLNKRKLFKFCTQWSRIMGK